MSSLPDLQALIQEKYGLDPSLLDPQASLRDKGVDSLAMVEFLFVIEDKYGISMRDEDSTIDSLAALAAAVDRTRAQKAAA
jgi:acyl carrier protein